MSVRWIPTDRRVYGAIYREHYKDFAVFSSCTCPEGDPRLGISLPYILTTWGFEYADEAIIKSEATKKSFEQEKYDYEYWIAAYVGESDE